MNVRYQSIQALVTCFGPFCDRSCKFVFSPKNIRSPNTCQIQALQKNNFESIRLTIHLQISILPLQSGGHRCTEQILCRVVETSCLLTHNIAPHISSHDLPYHKTMKKNENSWSMEVFQFPPLKSAMQTWLIDCPQYLCLCRIVVECCPCFLDPRKMLVLPNRLLC